MIRKSNVKAIANKYFLPTFQRNNKKKGLQRKTVNKKSKKKENKEKQ